MKQGLIYPLFLIAVFHSSCGQKQTRPHQDNINYKIKDTVTSFGANTMVRHVRQAANTKNEKRHRCWTCDAFWQKQISQLFRYTDN